MKGVAFFLWRVLFAQQAEENNHCCPSCRHYESAPEASLVPDFSSLSSCEEDGDSSGGLGTRCALEALKGNAFKTCILMFIQKRLF